jgi:hypothetical protein
VYIREPFDVTCSALLLVVGWTGLEEGKLTALAHILGWGAAVGCRTRLHHMTSNTLAPFIQAAVYRFHSSNHTNQTFTEHPGLSCKVYNMLWHTHDITQIRLRCRGVTRETRRGVGRF